MSVLHTMTRPPVALASGAALIALVGTTAAWSATGTSVQLTVDGAPRTVETRGGTVADVLAAAGLTAGEHDLLAPALDRPVADGDSVVLRHGRELRLVVDGQARSVWVTADDVDEALDQVGVRADGAVLSASRSRPIGLEGLALDVRLPKDVTVLADGKVRPRTTTAPTVGAVLQEAGVRLGDEDTVSLPLRSALTDESVVLVTRVRTARKVEQRTLPFSTVRRADASAFTGSERTVRAGRAGSERTTYELTFHDGERTGRKRVKVVRTPAVSRLVSYGTKERPAPAPEPVAPTPVRRAPAATAAPRPAAPSAPSTPSGSSGLDWAALARCESGGNPRAVSANGLYFGLYQFSLGTWQGVGGSGRPSDASASEQTARAAILYRSAGRSAWPTCGKYL